jgi:hypothetical protein
MLFYLTAVSVSIGQIELAAVPRWAQVVTMFAFLKAMLSGLGATSHLKKLNPWRLCVCSTSAQQVPSAFFIRSSKHSSRFSGSLLLLNAWLKNVQASSLLQPFNSSNTCDNCMTWQLHASLVPWTGPAADALLSITPAGSVCVLPA